MTEEEKFDVDEVVGMFDPHSQELIKKDLVSTDEAAIQNAQGALKQAALSRAYETELSELKQGVRSLKSHDPAVQRLRDKYRKLGLRI